MTTHNKSGVAYAWLAGFGPHEAVYSTDLMEFACHLGRDEAMDLARKIFARIDELIPKFERTTGVERFNEFARTGRDASVMGNTYPGGGCTLGPAMAFGCIAAMHAAGRSRQQEVAELTGG